MTCPRKQLWDVQGIRAGETFSYPALEVASCTRAKDHKGHCLFATDTKFSYISRMTIPVRQ